MKPAETHNKILDAARRLFTKNGFLGTTTREIARTANVNEVTLFRHFGSKEALFQEALQANSPVHELQKALEKEIIGDLQKDLNLLGHRFFKMMMERRQAILMTLWEAEQHPEIRPLVGVIPAAQRKILAKYFQGQKEQDNLQSVDPLAAAQAFLGMLMAYAININLLPTELQDYPHDKIIDQFVQIFLKGIQKEKEHKE